MLRNVKYFAGFIDSDGCISYEGRKADNDRAYLYPRVSLSQRPDRDAPLREFAEFWQVPVTTTTSGCSSVRLDGKNAIRCLEQVKRHLVLKQHLAEYCLSSGRWQGSHEEMTTKREEFKSLVQAGNPRVHNHPSRQWMAGYIDGDGCFASGFDKRNGHVALSLVIATSSYQTEGIQLIQKVFGGSLHKQGSGCTILNIPLNQPTKCNQVIGHFSQHLRIKGQQANLVRQMVNKGWCRPKGPKSREERYQLHRELCDMKRK